MSATTKIETDLTRILGIKHPILLAGMGPVSGADLAAAVSNAGGLGVIGGGTFTPRILKLQIKLLKEKLDDPSLPFGVDLLLPQTGSFLHKPLFGGQGLDKMCDILIETGCKLFVVAIGVPPKQMVDKLHSHNILVMNMVGHPKHVKYALNAGVDIICAQGTEAGGHTGSIPTSLLLPKCVDIIRDGNYKCPLYPNKNVFVVGAGGIYDGRGLVSALSYGCDAVWIGTRFVCAQEARCPIEHKKAIINASYDDTMRTRIYTGRTVRCIMNEDIDLWENKQPEKLKEYLKKGKIPIPYGSKYPPPHIAGMVCGAINDILPAKTIVDNIMKEAVEVIRLNSKKLSQIKSKL